MEKNLWVKNALIKMSFLESQNTETTLGKTVETEERWNGVSQTLSPTHLQKNVLFWQQKCYYFLIKAGKTVHEADSMFTSLTSLLIFCVFGFRAKANNISFFWQQTASLHSSYICKYTQVLTLNKNSF